MFAARRDSLEIVALRVLNHVRRKLELPAFFQTRATTIHRARVLAFSSVKKKDTGSERINRYHAVQTSPARLSRAFFHQHFRCDRSAGIIFPARDASNYFTRLREKRGFLRAKPRRRRPRRSELCQVSRYSFQIESNRAPVAVRNA